MKVIDFINLTDETQFDMLHDKGCYIDRVVEKEVEFQLYSIFTFYIELTVTLKVNSNIQLRAFTDGSRLDKYYENSTKFPPPWD